MIKFTLNVNYEDKQLFRDVEAPVLPRIGEEVFLDGNVNICFHKVVAVHHSFLSGHPREPRIIVMLKYFEDEYAERDFAILTGMGDWRNHLLRRR